MNAPGTGKVVQLLQSRGFDPSAEDDLLDLGLTSMQILQLADDLQHEIGVDVDVSVLLAAPTIGALEEQLSGADRTP
ncbi:acyl carrier protein [Dactylosporangium matsuzakiense]|uniref:Carrier domain-containing protein n=1 Tax=Dactylosporangium matsuzakiense TaxID=53360 RepID=A0A9W6NIT5_9ACTN|nr:acyl carrier protein [Dactylosporangium matsuzakiense]GLK99169.1 hypothetical protein GCM10017581_009100 [Dactylosporangium matsuzakiense]